MYYTLTVIDGHGGPAATGQALEEWLLERPDRAISQEVLTWLTDIGHDDTPDRWVMITEGGEPPAVLGVVGHRAVAVVSTVVGCDSED